MRKCLTEGEIAEYADYLCYGAEMPDKMVMTHVEQCLPCKQEIMSICDMMDVIESGTEPTKIP